MMDDRARYEAAFREQFARVDRFVRSRVEPESAKDVTAETFLAAWRSVDSMPDEPTAWLLTVARRKVADHYRARGRRDALLESLAPPVGSVADESGRLADRDRIRKTLHALSPDDRELLVLVAWDGLTPGQAARVVGCTAATFRVRLHRARSRFRTEYTRQDVDRAQPGPAHFALVNTRRNA